MSLSVFKKQIRALYNRLKKEPAEAGTYSLWQLVDDNNCHRGFIFEKEA